MPLIKSDHGTARVNTCSAQLVNKIHNELVAQSLGTALVMGNQVALLLPLPSQSGTLSAISVISKQLACEKRLPALHNFDHLVREGLSDEDCLAMSEKLTTINFVRIPNWNRWIVDYLQDMGEAPKLGKLVSFLDAGGEPKIDDFARAF